VGQIFEELDQSGARDDRPKLAEAIARVEAGQSDGLVVSELDRFGRSRVHGLAAIERIHAAGGTFVSRWGQAAMTSFSAYSGGRPAASTSRATAAAS
jgi:DNA invertase Pin-like site-specific DNA recombinase